MTKEELVKKILSIDPPVDLVTEHFDHEENGVIVKAKKNLLSRYGQYYLGIGEGWDWFDRDKTYLNRATGKIEKSFNDTLQEGHTFVQDATIEELEELLKYMEV